MSARSLLFVALALTAFESASAQCSTWAEGFRESSFDRLVRTSAWFDSGSGPKLYVGGEFSRAGGSLVTGLARWSGTQWEAVPGAPSSWVHELLVTDLGDGLALYVGHDGGVARFDGASWTPLGSLTGGGVRALATFDDGGGARLHAGGTFVLADGALSPGVARWTGSSWQTIGGVQGEGLVADLCVWNDGSGDALFVSGSFQTAGGVPSSNVARWNGSSWATLAGGLGGRVFGLAVFDAPSGPRLAAAGEASISVRQWDGSSWSSVAPSLGYAGVVQALESWDSDGNGTRELFLGREVVTGGPGQSALMRLDGSTWTTLGGVVGHVYGIDVIDDGKGARLFATGSFGRAGAIYGGDVASWSGTWTNATSGNAPTEGSVLAMAHYDDGSGEALFAAGTFLGAADVLTSRIARWNGHTWSALGSGTNGDVRALTTFDDGSGTRLWAGGSFTSAGGVAVAQLAGWNGSTWSALPSSNGQLATGSSIDALCVHDDGSGPALYVAGDLNHTSLSSRGILRWSEGAWHDVANTWSGAVKAMTVHDDGSGPALYTVGPLTISVSGPTLNVAKWDGTSWTGLGSGIASAELRAVVEHDDGTGRALYVGGFFGSAGGSPAAGVARWRSGAWEPVGDGFTQFVRALTTFDRGSGERPELIAVGSFTQTASGTVARRVAAWNGAAWSEISGGISGAPGATDVRCVATWDDSGGRDLYVGGEFQSAGAVVSSNFARLEGCGATGRLFCFGDGSSQACPCGNASPIGERAGCVHSLGGAATLRARGDARLSHDTLVLEGAAMSNSSALYFQGANVSNGGFGVAFGDGVSCTGGPFVRLGTKSNSAGTSSYPEAGDAAISIRGFLSAATTQRYQVRYRNAADYCTDDTFNFTNAVEILWQL